MEAFHCEPCQIVGVETKAHNEADALEEHTLPSETWSKNSNKVTGPFHSSQMVVEDSTISIPFSEPLLSLILKMPASLQPLCFGGSPVTLPVEVHLAGGVEAQTIATPVITPTPGCLTQPLIFDQPHIQCLNPLSSCPITEQQNLLCSQQHNNELSQNLSLQMGQSQSGERKSNISQPVENTAMHSSEFLTALQESFPFLRNYSSSACRGSSFSTGFILPDTALSHLYTGSPLVSLLPPATLLVPFPFVVPLPVPLPIPIPIFPDPGSLSRTSHTMKTSKSSQTMTEDIPVCTHNKMSGYNILQFPVQPPTPVSQEQVLDLTVKGVPIQTKQEVQFPFHQDNVLDLSMANKSCLETGQDTKLKHHGRNSTNEESTKLILPVKYSQTQGINQSNSYSDIEFSMQYKWTKKERCENYAIKYSGQNGRVMTPKQIPRVTQSTKDTSVMFCEKPPQGQVLKDRAVKQKRVKSQNINIPPIKKQHLMKFLPSK